MDAFDKRTLLHRNVDFSTKQTTDEIKQIYAKKLKQADINGAVFELSFPVSPADPLHWCVRDIKDKDSALLVTFSSEIVAAKYFKEYKGTEDLISLASLEVPFSLSGRTNNEDEKGQISSPLSSNDEDMEDTVKSCEIMVQQLQKRYQDENKKLREKYKEKDEIIELKANFKEKEVSLQKEREKLDESYRKLQADAADIRNFRTTFREKCDEIKTLREEIQFLLQEKDEALDSCKSAQDEIKCMKKQITKLAEDNVKLKNRLDETKQDGKMYSMENQIDDLKEHIKKLEAENSKLKERNKRLSKIPQERNHAWDDDSGGEREFSSPKVGYGQSDSSFSSRLGCASDTPNSIQSKGSPVMTDDQKIVKKDDMVRGDENEYASSESNFLSCDEPEEDKQDCIDENKQDKLGPDVREKTSDGICTTKHMSHRSQTMQQGVVPHKAAPYDYQIEEPVSPAVAHYLLKISNFTKILHERYKSVEVTESPTGLVLCGRYQDQVQKAHKRFKEHLNGIKHMKYDIPSNFKIRQNDLMQIIGSDVAVVMDKKSEIIYLAAENHKHLEYAFDRIKEKTNLDFLEPKDTSYPYVAEGYLEIDVYKYIVGQSMSEGITEGVALKFYPDEKEHMARYSLKGHDKSLVDKAEASLVEQIQKCMHENCTQDIYIGFLSKKKMEEFIRFKRDNQDILIEHIQRESKIHLIGPKKKTYILKKKLCDWLGITERSNETDMDVDEEPIATFQGQKVTSSFGSEHEKPRQHCITYQSRSNDIKVHAIVADITKMEVDVIVNAANTKLSHDGGIALAIANAGGKKLKDACKDYMKKNKQGVQVGKYHMTVAGDLPCTAVFHAVGPQYNEMTLEKALSELKNAFRNCLRGANSIKRRNIAIPAISSGIFGMPAVYVAETLANVVNDFVSTSKDHLKEIYLVDKGQQMVNLFEKQLDQQKSLIKQSASQSMPSEPSEGWTQVDYNRSHSKTSQHKRGQHRRGAAERKHSSNDGGSVRHSSNSKETQRQSSLSEYDGTSTGPENEDCPICQEPVTKRRILSKCQHVFCTDCIDEAFKYKPVCPICGVIYGRLTGNQPKNGRMQHRVDLYQHLPGYPRDGTIVIDYHFPDGYQGEDHPEPGARYRGGHRTAYLPDNTHGRKVLMLLKKAFDARLVFTVGRSVTSGMNNIVTWNDIHHKTHTHGGAQGYGYPDPDYLRRVEEELAAKGITE